MHAVGADQRRAFEHAPVLVGDAHGLVADVDVHDARRGVQRDILFRLYFLVDRQVNVGAMNDRVGIAEALAELLAHRHLADHRFVHGVHHDEVVGVDGARAGAGPAAQRVHRRERIGAELDARADFADLGGLLQHDDVEASLVEAERARHAADAAAHHDDGVVLVAAHP